MTREDIIRMMRSACDTHQLIENIFDVAYRMGYRDSLVDAETNRNRFEEDEVESLNVVH